MTLLFQYYRKLYLTLHYHQTLELISVNLTNQYNLYIDIIIFFERFKYKIRLQIHIGRHICIHQHKENNKHVCTKEKQNMKPNWKLYLISTKSN